MNKFIILQTVLDTTLTVLLALNSERLVDYTKIKPLGNREQGTVSNERVSGFRIVLTVMRSSIELRCRPRRRLLIAYEQANGATVNEWVSACNLRDRYWLDIDLWIIRN